MALLAHLKNSPADGRGGALKRISLIRQPPALLQGSEFFLIFFEGEKKKKKKKHRDLPVVQ